MQTRVSRRQILLEASASLAGWVFLPAARASTMAPDPLQRLLGKSLDSAVPGNAFQAAEFIKKVIGLERLAKTLDLPRSPLSIGENDIPSDVDQLYEMAMPRLVALIDSAEFRDEEFADKAGELLARLHETQHVVAEALGALALGGSELRSLSFHTVRPRASSSLNSQNALRQTELILADGAAMQPPLPARIARSVRFEDIAEEYGDLLSAAAIRSEHSQAADWHLTMLRKSRDRYEAVSAKTGVPWYFVGAIHGLEASFNFRAHLHNGDFPLSQRTHHVPAGRPKAWLPPSDWDSSAVDALRLMGFADVSDWSSARTLYRLEAFNGFGYRRLGRTTPYLWSFSTNYDRGKFVADGRFDARARSQQCGAAVMLKLLAEASEISFA